MAAPVSFSRLLAAALFYTDYFAKQRQIRNSVIDGKEVFRNASLIVADTNDEPTSGLGVEVSEKHRYSLDIREPPRWLRLRIGQVHIQAEFPIRQISGTQARVIF